MKVVSNIDIIEAYNKTGSVWKAGDIVGLCGQTVHERLVKLGLNKPINILTEGEKLLIRNLYNEGFKSGDGKLNNLCAEIKRTKPFVSRYAKKVGLSNIKRKCDDRMSKVISDNTKRYIKENGHPKGFMGYKHTEDSLKLISESSKIFAKSITKSRRREITMKTQKTKFSTTGRISAPTNRGPWKAGWREIGANKKYYRSRWEANYARYLQFKMDQGLIKEWFHEDKVFWFDMIKRGVVSYLPDFRVVSADGSEEFHEVKGWMDAKSATKIKRMKKYYPTVVLKVIQADWFKSNKNLSNIVKGWE